MEEEQKSAEAAPRRHVAARILAVIGIIAAIAAWGIYFFDVTFATVLGAIGVIASAIGIRAGRGCLRDLAITALIASAILVIVVCAFYFALKAVS